MTAPDERSRRSEPEPWGASSGPAALVHGTQAAYTHGRCRCPRCRRAHRNYDRHRSRMIAYGRWRPLVDAESVRAHLRELAAAGLGYRRVAELAGVSEGVTRGLLYGRPVDGKPPSSRIRVESAARLLAVRPGLDQQRPYGVVDGAGARRRLQALVAMGWPQRHLAALVGVTEHTMGQLLGSTRGVQVATAQAAWEVYDQLWARRGPSNRARARAHRRGWVGPLAWDDASVDDPQVPPDVGASASRSAALAEDFQELTRQGHTPVQAAKRLGVSTDAAYKARVRARAVGEVETGDAA